MVLEGFVSASLPLETEAPLVIALWKKRDRVPLEWADTIGQEALALMTLADRTSDIAMAQRAVDQLIEAEAALSEGGHVAWAKTFADALPEAKALVARLQGDTSS